MSNHDEHEVRESREITIDTLSSPPMRIPIAPLSRRIVAGGLDSFIILIIYSLVTVWQKLPALIPFDTYPSIAGLTLLATMTFLYYFILEGAFAATIGKSILKIRVLSNDGEACSFGASFTRNVLRFVDWLPMFYLVACVAIFVSQERRRVGDRVAGTVVSRTPEKDINPPPAPFLFH